MSFAALCVLAFGLAMDATAVAASKGCGTRELRAHDVLKVALLFGGFQAGMPLAGYLLGARVGAFVSSWDHWLAFAVLSVLGAKMLWESRAEAESLALADESDTFGWRGLLALSVATSIDAFAVGFTLPMLGAPLVLSLLTIGLITALTSALGLLAGHRFGRLLGPRLDLLGGLLLLALGTGILVQHLSAPG